MKDAKLVEVEPEIPQILQLTGEIQRMLEKIEPGMIAGVPLIGSERSATWAKLASALTKAQSEVKGAKKEGFNPHFERSYSSLADCWAACREALAKNELAVAQLPYSENEKIGLMTYLLHSSGEYIGSKLLLTPARNDPQSVGSLITYMRRYGLCAMVGISPEDDDGEKSMPAKAQPPKQAAAAGKKQQTAKAPESVTFNGVVQAVLALGDDLYVVFEDRVCVAGPTNRQIQQSLMNSEGKHMSMMLQPTDKKSKTGLPVYAILSCYQVVGGVKDGAGAS
jgi:hypothetical protein